MSGEVAFVLETIRNQWPGAEWPDNLYRINRDDPLILETDERTKSLELTLANGIGASLGESFDEGMGLSYNFRVRQRVGIRIEGLHARENGEITSDAEFNNLVDNVKESIKRERKHPSLDGGARDYHTLTLENEQNNSSENRDYYRADLDVVFHGYEIRDD